LRFSQVPNRELLDSVSPLVDRTIALSATKTIGMRLNFIFLLLVLGSCTIAKRVHRPGLFIQWNNAHTPQKPAESSNKTSQQLLTSADLNESFDFEHSEETEKKEHLYSTEIVKSSSATNKGESAIRPKEFQPLQTLTNTIRAAEQLKNKDKTHETKSAVTNTVQKPRSFYMGMGIISILLIFALGIILLATLGSPVLYYTAGIAMLGIPLLFIYALKNIKIARSIPKVEKIRVTPTKAPTESGNKPDNSSNAGSQDKIKTANTAAITSFVLFITSILLIFVPFLSLLLFIASVIAGIIAISRNNKSPFHLRYTGLAWASVGITITFVAILLITLILFL
jgi:hypothetical protein